ncbi:hypothetical protein [Tamlana sp. I1]|uniref:hypothetical protein n=1 Tax=Tamlana sp. I1 TaxID=2762061 RepID=UPI0018908877|nr:hypothetical protein [Tamlana sp. I1]
MNNALEALKALKYANLKVNHPLMPEHAIPRPKYTDRNSNGLTRCVIDWIKLNGFQAERINSMGRMIDNRETIIDSIGRSRNIGSVTWTKGTGQVGTADISATIKGRSVKIEIKCKATGDNKQSPEQKEYQKSVEAAGGVYLIVRTFQSFFDWYVEFVKM